MPAEPPFPDSLPTLAAFLQVRPLLEQSHHDPDYGLRTLRFRCVHVFTGALLCDVLTGAGAGPGGEASLPLKYAERVEYRAGGFDLICREGVIRHRYLSPEDA